MVEIVKLGLSAKDCNPATIFDDDEVKSKEDKMTKRIAQTQDFYDERQESISSQIEKCERRNAKLTKEYDMLLDDQRKLRAKS